MTITNRDYHRLPGIGSTTAKRATSPRAWVTHRIDGEPPRSASTVLAMDMGTALHSLVLEGVDVMREGVTLDATGQKREDMLAALAIDCDYNRIVVVKNRQSRKEIEAAREAGLIPIADDECRVLAELAQQAAGAAAGLVYLDADSIAIVRRAAQTVEHHPGLREVIGREALRGARIEASLACCVDLEVDGVPARVLMKARPDAIVGTCLRDLKSIRPDTPLTARTLTRTIEDRAYDLSLAWYSRVLSANGIATETHRLCWVHMGGDFDGLVTTLDATYQDRGWSKAAQALAAIVRGERWLAHWRPDVARHSGVEIGEGWLAPEWCPGAECGEVVLSAPRWGAVED